jgi:predicted nucleotidyltransferase
MTLRPVTADDHGMMTPEQIAARAGMGQMIEPAAIIQWAEEVARAVRPERVILFGSYAYGSPTDDSDVDLLVIMPDGGQPQNRAVNIRLRHPAPFPLDLVVMPPETLRERLGQGDFFLREVVTKGVLLYDAADDRVGGQGRRRLRDRFARGAVAQRP